MKKYLGVIVRGVVIALSCCSFTAFADINFNGFASIRGTAADSDGTTSPHSTLQGDGNLNFKDESLFALQASATLTDSLSATVQLMAEGKNDFEVEARWAYLSYDLTDSHRLSAGRFANPIFFQSQYEKVGYAHNFSRLPKAVYIGFDFATIEGISIDSTFFVGDNTLETKLLYGSWSGELYVGAVQSIVNFGLENVISFNATLSGDWWKVFMGGFTSEIDGGTLDDVYRQFAAPGVEAALATGASQSEADELIDSLISDGKTGIYLFTGFGIDYNNFIFDFEYADYGINDSTDSPNKVWYASLGYRFNDMVITVHTEENGQKPDFSTLSGISNPILVGTGQGVISALGSTETDGSGVTLRYDFHPSAALKIDYFSGNSTNPTIGDYTIWSVGVDTVF